MASTNINSLFSVKGRVALVTGGTSGIGLMIAKGLVTNGCKVYVCGLSSDPIAEVEESLDELGKQSGGTAYGFSCDLKSEDGIAAISKFIRDRESHLDILISNAGIRRDPVIACNPLTASLPELQASLLSSSHSDWLSSFQVNTMAHYFLSVSLLDLLAAAGERELRDEKGKKTGRKGREEGCGVVVATSSIASLHNATNVDMMSYATTKAATDHLVFLLAAKFARWYVRVVGINPGLVPSNMNPMGTGSGADIFGDLVSKVPAKRAGGLDDMVGIVLFLVSKAGAYVDGRSIAIDGGRTLFANGQV